MGNPLERITKKKKKKYIKSSTSENGDIAQFVRKEKDENGMFIINFMQ